MKYAVGYQQAEMGSSDFLDVVGDYKCHIAEVFFPWVDMPTGRMSIENEHGSIDWTVQQKLEEDLIKMSKMGIKLDLLLNSNCNGKYSLSKYLANKICSIVDHIYNIAGKLDIVTTTSPFVARVIKTNFKDIEIRASVNMRIGTVKGMQYVSHLFDSFHMQREFNRDFEKIEELRKWAGQNGKSLVMLANSGCMNYCSGQTFHDNCVAHEIEINETDNVEGFIPHMCWNYLKEKGNRVSVLQNSWVRPEDIHNYEPYFKVVKLATRMHSRMRMVVEAYTSLKFHGNLLDLFEPGYGPAFVPNIIDNDKFPSDWFEKTKKCKKDCHTCGYCSEVLQKVLVKMSGE